MVDAHSKWPKIIQMSTTTWNKTIEVMHEVFSRNGIPECLVSDNGLQFVTEVFQNFMKVNGLRHVTSAPYHPRTNGQVKRLVYTFKQEMKASSKHGGTIQKGLSNFLLAYCSTPYSTTGESPAILFMGRTLQTRLSLIKPTVESKMNREQEKMFVKTINVQLVHLTLVKKYVFATTGVMRINGFLGLLHLKQDHCCTK